jgi:adenylate kinase family enzyme
MIIFEKGGRFFVKNVIHIFGASGSGTSTLGKKISEALGYKFMDTDDYFWVPTDPKFTSKRSREERIALMTRDINRFDNVVISGSLVDWGDVLIPYFTLAIRIETETDIRIDRLKKREKERFGARIGPGGDMHRQHLEFIEWAKAYDTGGVDMRSKAKHDEWQKLLLCELLVLNGADAPESNLEKVKKHLNEQK